MQTAGRSTAPHRLYGEDLMCKVARIEWTYRTASIQANEVASRVRVEVFRDGQPLTDLIDAPLAMASLGQPCPTTRVVTFAVPTTPTDNPSELAFEEFPDGVRGHLDVRFQVDGPDAWQVRAIESTIVLAELRPALAAPGAYEWRESYDRFEFDGVGVIHADPCDATSILELSY